MKLFGIRLWWSFTDAQNAAVWLSQNGFYYHACYMVVLGTNREICQFALSRGWKDSRAVTIDTESECLADANEYAKNHGVWK